MPSDPFDDEWAMEQQSIDHIRQRIEEHKPRSVLEFGSGRSTMQLGPIVGGYGGEWNALEHEVGFAVMVTQLLHKETFTRNVYVWPVGLRRKFYDWPEGIWPIDSFDMLIVDGPPAQDGSRYPAVPQYYDRLVPGGWVFLDDALREEEFHVFERWRDEFEWSHVALRNSGRGLAELRKPE